MSEPKKSLEMALFEQSSALDGVQAEVSLGIRNQRHFDELEERVDTICTAARAAFRSARP
ncbi:hypothetical protein [Qipengyuania sp. SM2507]